MEFKKCLVCKKEIKERNGEAIPTHENKTRKFCSRDCFGIYHSKYKIDNHVRPLHLSGRNYIRELIRIRDNHECQICGKKWVEGGRRFDVHHKDCLKEKTKQYDNYESEKDNMTTLCHKCHLNLPEHKLTMWISRNKDNTNK
jgi:5-methylcytosine-specific restriction endonuclease McrA